MKKQTRARLEHGAEAGVAGAVTGAVIGAIGGAPGAAVGAILGAAAGALAEFVIEKELAVKKSEDAILDDAIGVSGGEMGAPNLEHPPPRFGAYSGASSGASSGGGQTADGPIPPSSS